MKLQKISTALLFVFACCCASAQAQTRSAGIGIRGTYWDMHRSGTLLRIENYNDHRLVDLGAGGGWLTFLSRTSDSWFLEFSLGGIAKEVESVQYFGGEDTHVLAVVPVLAGMRFDLLTARNRGALRPYVAFGAGPYWVADIFVQDRFFEEEVHVESDLHAGGYLGGGIDFMIFNWFGLNFDVRRHFVNFDAHNEHSGYEYGMGVQFMWGNYRAEHKPKRERCCH